MDFAQKLQELRKSRGLTQEELAQILYVSRTAVSKWESGRGYPNIDSLKEISAFFSVSIDDLLSGERLISIAQTENKDNMRRLCSLISAFSELLFLIPMLLPLYPDSADGFIYCVALMNYTETSELNILIYWLAFSLFIVSGFVRLIFIKADKGRLCEISEKLSVALNALAVIVLALTREVYALIVVFCILALKSVILFKRSEKEL